MSGCGGGQRVQHVVEGTRDLVSMNGNVDFIKSFDLDRLDLLWLLFHYFSL